MFTIAHYISHKVTEKTFKAKVPGAADRVAKELQATFIDLATKSPFTLSFLASNPLQLMVPELPPMTPVEVHLAVRRGDFGDELVLSTFKPLDAAVVIPSALPPAAPVPPASLPTGKPNGK